MKSFKQRIIQYDFIRIIACFFIVLMHSPIPTNSIYGPFLSALSFFTAPAICLFFMISGALILPIKQSFSKFVLKKLIRIGLPLIIWTLIYLSLNIYFSKSEINIVKTFFSIPFSAQGTGVLWFIYTILGLYILSPILSEWIKKVSKKELEFYLIIWGITLCYPFFDFFIEINESQTGILYYFSGYLGYYVLGYYLRNFSNKYLFWISCTIGIIGIGLILFLKYYNVVFDFYRLFWYLSIFIAAWSVVYWYIILSSSKIFPKIYFLNWIIKISNLTFGVYLIHILIMREWLWKTNFILDIQNYYIQTITVAILSFFLSLTCCFIISKIPFLRIIIGLNSKKFKLEIYNLTF